MVPEPALKYHAPTRPGGGGVALATVTATPVAFPMFPAASVAEAVSVWEPLALVVVSHAAWKGPWCRDRPGATRPGGTAPRSLPCRQWRSAATVTVPETDAPAAGEVIETVGGVVSPVTVALTSAEGALMFPAASRAVTR